MISSISFSGVKAIKGFSEDVDKAAEEVKNRNLAKGVPTEIFNVAYMSKPIPQCGSLIVTGEEDIFEKKSEESSGEIYNQFRFDKAEEAKSFLEKIKKGIINTVTLESKK